MGGLTVAFEILRFLLALGPLWLFVRQDLRRWKVRDSVLMAMLALVPVIWVLDVSAFGSAWYEPAIGALVFLGVSLAIREASFRATGIDAFGLADVVLAAFAGVFLGWKAILVWLLLGSVLGVAHWALLSALRKRKGRRPWRRVPAGPAFATAQIVLMALAAGGLYSGFPFA